MSSLPFERLDGESELAFAACLLYVLLPPDIRSVKAAQDIFYKNSKIPSRKENQASRGWEVFASKFRWRERASLLDQQRAIDFLEVEKLQMLKTKEHFNKLGDVKQQNQLKLEILFSGWIDRGMKKGYFGGEDEDSEETGVRLEQATKIQKALNESDGKLYDRVLKSIGIESLIPD